MVYFIISGVVIGGAVTFVGNLIMEQELESRIYKKVHHVQDGNEKVNVRDNGPVRSNRPPDSNRGPTGPTPKALV